MKKGSKTLFLSVIMSAPGPLILGVGMLQGRSNTQIADFVRRSIELLAIIASFTAYHISMKKQMDVRQEKKLGRNTNLFVGGMMLLAGAAMLGIALLSDNEDKGNVVFALIVAALGLVANTAFWMRYKKLGKNENSAILEVQSKLYRAKSLVDLCVVIALTAVLLVPGSQTAKGLDLFGSIIVAVYLAASGIKVIKEFRYSSI